MVYGPNLALIGLRINNTLKSASTILMRKLMHDSTVESCFLNKENIVTTSQDTGRSPRDITTLVCGVKSNSTLQSVDPEKQLSTWLGKCHTTI